MAQPPHYSYLENGSKYYIRSVVDGGIVSLVDGNFTNDNPYVNSPNAGPTAKTQQFIVEYKAGGILFKLAANQNTALHLNATNKVNVTLWSYVDSSNLYWYLVPVPNTSYLGFGASFQVKNKLTDAALRNQGHGKAFQVAYPDLNDQSQHFVFEKIY